MTGLPPEEVLVPLVRLLLAALLGAIAGASLVGALHRRARRRGRDAALADAAGRAETDEELGRALARALERVRAGERRLEERDEAFGALERAGEMRDRAGRRRVETLLAEQQAAEERQSRLEAELRALRAERDLVALARPARARSARQDGVDAEGSARTGRAGARRRPPAAEARPEGVPVLNRRAAGGAHEGGGARIDDYPMLAESELPERADSLQLEDLLD